MGKCFLKFLTNIEIPLHMLNTEFFEQNCISLLISYIKYTLYLYSKTETEKIVNIVLHFEFVFIIPVL